MLSLGLGLRLGGGGGGDGGLPSENPYGSDSDWDKVTVQWNFGLYTKAVGSEKTLYDEKNSHGLWLSDKTYIEDGILKCTEDTVTSANIQVLPGNANSDDFAWGRTSGGAWAYGCVAMIARSRIDLTSTAAYPVYWGNSGEPAEEGWFIAYDTHAAGGLGAGWWQPPFDYGTSLKAAGALAGMAAPSQFYMLCMATYNSAGNRGYIEGRSEDSTILKSKSALGLPVMTAPNANSVFWLNSAWDIRAIRIASGHASNGSGLRGGVIRGDALGFPGA